MTVAEAQHGAAERLAAVSDAPELEAQWLMLEVLQQPQASWLVVHGTEKLSSRQQQRLQKLLVERVTGTPLAYVLGYWDFYGRRFMVTPDVLIPRPTTEQLVEQALELLKKKSKKLSRSLVLTDIGTGSGCLAVTLLLEGSGWIKKVYATDISWAALAVAKKNAEQHAVADRIEFLAGNMLEPLAGKKIDVIVSNPPYIPTVELERSLGSPTPDTLGLRFEPRGALDGGLDGQKFIVQIKTTGIPALVEVTGGNIARFNS